ncbi:hypothetical protein ARMGADRAFT_450565 [Armillaria gallica]|uniref:Uncharacterized protein n=1 Tax=Armillaria gallica TaxID=47427 RepID=A0A2H3CXC4_ARMGA|nr:hypothetical protein ARMGADRAFT_450565 [Armillaria gallica]
MRTVVPVRALAKAYSILHSHACLSTMDDGLSLTKRRMTRACDKCRVRKSKL